MTGFASIGRETANEMVTVTMKSVNHRFLDVALKAPSVLASLEPRVKAIVQQRLTRGRVEIHLSAQVTTPIEREIVVDEALLERVSQAFDNARLRGVLSGPLTVSDALRIPQAFEIRTKSEDKSSTAPESLVALVEQVLDDALAALGAMRTTEGAFLETDLNARLATVSAFVDALEAESREGQRALETRLRDRLNDLPADLRGDENAMAREVVRFVSRSDIDEEVVRMRSHLQHWHSLVASDEPCGRKLDFLVQEMNREINTMGSKVESARATEVVIAAKAELERIREQVQNVE
jgi:uncharacterized protein (TIGR00255 family)